MEMANFEGSGLLEVESAGIFGLGTGIYVFTRETLDCFWTWCSGRGAPSAWTLTAIPLKHGILLQVESHVAKIAPQMMKMCPFSRDIVLV
jgi:hypothetical protein